MIDWPLASVRIPAVSLVAVLALLLAWKRIVPVLSVSAAPLRRLPTAMVVLSSWSVLFWLTVIRPGVAVSYPT